LKKLHASSDKNNTETNYLPSETLWRATQLITQKGIDVLPIDAEPAPQEMLGLAIGILRRRKHISRIQLAQSIGCTVDKLLALETGLLPASDFVQYLPLILHEIGIPEKSLQPFLINIKIA